MVEKVSKIPMRGRLSPSALELPVRLDCLPVLRDRYIFTVAKVGRRKRGRFCLVKIFTRKNALKWAGGNLVVFTL